MLQSTPAEKHQNGVLCPQCASSDSRPSLTRTLTDFFLFLFSYANLRCRNCNARFRFWPSRAVVAPRQVLRRGKKYKL